MKKPNNLIDHSFLGDEEKEMYKQIWLKKQKILLVKQ